MKAENIKNTLKILGFLVVLIGLFIFFVLMGSSSSNLMMQILYVALIVVQIYFTSDVVGLLYKFYEMKRPWQRFIPVINEFYLLDVKFRVAAWVSFIISMVLLLMAFAPYQVKIIFGAQFVASGGFYLFLISFVMLLICQLIVGVGIINSMKEIAEEWERISGCTLGLIGLYKVFAIIPVLRVFAFYGLRKPLDTLVTFNHKTVSTENNVRIAYEEEDE